MIATEVQVHLNLNLNCCMRGCCDGLDKGRRDLSHTWSSVLAEVEAVTCPTRVIDLGL